ncbi:phosphoribosylglycinamide formyltransferase [Halobacteriales archaeon QS_8_69_26]|nr:MAG: phosphoribosylglycinamide formyltransferase [Halobacteriales archaeon QS_8_69_26]
MLRIAGLASNRGRNLLHIQDRSPGGAELSVVLTNDADAPVLDEAAARGIPTEVVEREGDGRRDHERRILDALADHPVDLVCLDGYMRILSDTFLDAVPTTLNVHPSLLPSFPGVDAWGDALDAGVRVTGCTVHVVTNAVAEDGSIVEDEIDAGPAVTQEPVPVYEGDDTDALKRRVLYEGEFQAYPRAVRWFAEDRVTVDREARTVAVEGDEADRFPARRIRTDDRVRFLQSGDRTHALDRDGETDPHALDRDGETDPHPTAALYADETLGEPTVVAGEPRTDGRLSTDDYAAADAALALVRGFDRPAAAVVTHATPAGCAVAGSVAEACDRALATDPAGATDGAVALNRECDPAAAEAVAARGGSGGASESGPGVVVAPGYAAGALDALRDGDRRALAVAGDLDDRTEETVETPLLGGSILRARPRSPTADDLRVVSDRDPGEATVDSLVFALRVVGHAPRKAVVLAGPTPDGRATGTVGIGAGQTTRADALHVARHKAHARGAGSASGGVLAADGPLSPGGIEAAASAGIEAIVHPGSPDGAAVDTANDHGPALVVAGDDGPGRDR